MAELFQGVETAGRIQPDTADAKPGDRFVANFEVQDVAERPMTRFARLFIDVVAWFDSESVKNL